MRIAEPRADASILEENRKLHDEVTELKEQLTWFKRRVFGTRSERFEGSELQTKLALGRKNWLFADNEDAARNMAVIYTVLSTCRLHGLNSRDYITDLLRKLPARKSSEFDDLLPWNWKPVAA